MRPATSLAFSLGVSLASVPLFLADPRLGAFVAAAAGLGSLALAGASFRRSRRALEAAARMKASDRQATDDRGEDDRQRARWSAQNAAEILVQALSERSSALARHAEEVAELAETIALRLELSEDRIEVVRRAAELHDVGKLAIPDTVLDKPGLLSDDEWRLMREHTLIGERIIASATGLAELGRIVRATHERIDGEGYPDGLVSQEIPLEAKVIAVADAFCVMTSERPYDGVLSAKDALNELWRCAGTQFDRDVVGALDAVLGERQPPMAQVEATTRVLV